MINGLPTKLRQMRVQNGLSQRKIARRLGVSASIISGYETGERTPSLENLLLLSHLYRCTTDYLLGREAQTPENVVNVEGLSEKQVQLLRELVDTMRTAEFVSKV